MLNEGWSSNFYKGLKSKHFEVFINLVRLQSFAVLMDCVRMYSFRDKSYIFTLISLVNA